MAKYSTPSNPLYLVKTGAPTVQQPSANDENGVILPLLFRAYHFSKAAPSYGQLAKWAGVTAQEAIRRLLDIAARCGAAGIVMECVDPGNYPLADCKVIRDFKL